MQKLKTDHQFKVGDRVKVKQFSGKCPPPDGYNFMFSTDMMKYGGEILEITSIASYHRGKIYKMECDGFYCWEEWMFDRIIEDVNDKVFNVLLGKDKGVVTTTTPSFSLTCFILT